MLPGNLNPKKMQAMLKQLGIKSRELEAETVSIRLENGKEILIQEPKVTEIDMAGQKNFQVAGRIIEQSASNKESISESDIKFIAEKANVSEKKARKALEKSNSDVARALLLLSK